MATESTTRNVTGEFGGADWYRTSISEDGRIVAESGGHTAEEAQQNTSDQYKTYKDITAQFNR